MRTIFSLLLVLCSFFPLRSAYALTPEEVTALTTGDNDAKIQTLNKIAAAGDQNAIAFLQALSDGQVQIANGTQALIVKDNKATDVVTGQALAELPTNLEDVVINNRVRREIGATLAALKLASGDKDMRLAAAKTLQSNPDDALLPLLDAALKKEGDAEVKQVLALTRAAILLGSQDAAQRLSAVQALAEASDPSVKTLLLGLLEKRGEQFAEPDAAVRAQAQKSLAALESRLSTGEQIGRVFSGISLGSILLLAALGLAITYGLMGVINMAHGELIMIGAYATFIVQNLFRSYLPGAFDYYLLCAVPVSFAVAALVGMALERSVIRFLYGRPLETLLATWGISLMLMQLVRSIFGAQNVTVENPVWMSGGVQLLSNVVLPYNRIVIIGFAFAVLLLVWLMLTRTRLGLFVRAVTQNRTMAGCVGVSTGQVDMWAFGLGSGIAGLAGCALSQIGNVGPDLGQSYIVDSFMVVVLGGVGQLAGTVTAGLGLGVVNKFLEPYSGAVLAKIFVLVFIIIFIQKRPQGLFALKGRFVEG